MYGMYKYSGLVPKIHMAKSSMASCGTHGKENRNVLRPIAEIAVSAPAASQPTDNRSHGIAGVARSWLKRQHLVVTANAGWG